MQTWFPVGTRLFLVYFFAVLFFLRSQPFNDPGALWHIRVGDIILESGFPTTDPFTWSYHKSPWIPQQWLAECNMSILHAIGGFDALLLGLATLVASFGTWVGLRFVRGGMHWMSALVLSGLGITVAAFHFYIRPHMFTFLLLGFLMGLLVDTERDGVRWRRWLLWIPLCILWTNLHGGVLAGLFTIGLALGGWTIWGWWFGVGPILKRKTFLRLGFILVLCSLTIFINPFGLEMLRTWWSIVGSKQLPQIISEHKPISLSNTDGLGVILFGIFYLVMLAGVYPQRPRVTWLIPLAWLVLAFSSIRHGPLFCAVGVVALADFFPQTCWYRWLKRNGDTLIVEPETIPKPTSRLVVFPTLLVLFSILSQAMSIRVPILGAGWARLDPRGIPVELVERLQKYAASRPKGYPIFNDANLGGFLIYFTPTLKIYFDDRCELFRDEGLAEYVDFVSLHPERIHDLMKEWHFELLLVGADTPLEAYLSQHPESFKKLEPISIKAVLFERVQ